MMEFEHAAQRLARDQAKYRGRKNVVLSDKAKKQAEYRKKQQEKLRKEREAKKRQEEYVKSYYHSCNRRLGVKSLSSTLTDDSNLQLVPTSIHGDGDKIALPPSVLEFLTKEGADLNNGSPWTFRVGIVNQKYNFPASTALKNMTAPKDDDEHDLHEDADGADEDEVAAESAYLDELNEKYLSYTHGTVVEFTQEEGHIGLPKLISSALLNPTKTNKNSNSNSGIEDTMEIDDKFEIPATRTVDPAGDAVPVKQTEETDGAQNEAMDIGNDDDADESQTPGHLAWGAFDIPALPVEIALLRLPKGRACTLTPTKEAILNGFYNLKDVKLVLEQSLIRTRATLSVGDTVYTWHRGKKFDLEVSEVVPATYQAISCINTDIEVTIGEVKQQQHETEQGTLESSHGGDNNTQIASGGRTLGGGSTSAGGGYTLAGGLINTPSTDPVPGLEGSTTANAKAPELLEEPPASQSDGVCTVQIRTPDGGIGRRRFDVNRATMTDLFAFAASVIGASGGVGLDLNCFRLVTRFPRKVFSTSTQIMKDGGIQPGQELFMVEKIE